MKKEQIPLFKFEGVRVVHVPKSVGTEPLGEGLMVGEGFQESSGSPLFYNVHFDSGELYSMCEYDLKRIGV